VTAAAASGAAASRGEGLRRAYRDRRYAVLFYTLFLTLGAMPLLTAFGFSADVLQVFLALSLLLAVLDVPDQRWRTVLVLLAAVAFGVRAVPLAAVGAGMATGALVVVSGIALLAVVSTIRFALRAGAVGSEHVYAALSAYLLAGLFFGLLYWAVALAWPASFADAGRPGAAGFPLSTAIYYSFVTLATLGYGDVIPRTDVARGIAVVEAVGGQLYVAVMIARLVGARLQAHEPRGDSTRGAGST
jgi:hypothetical protein